MQNIIYWKQNHYVDEKSIELSELVFLHLRSNMYKNHEIITNKRYIKILYMLGSYI